MWQQALRMKTLHPQFAATIRQGTALWRGDVNPTPLSATYTVEVRYERGSSPRISVISPSLDADKNGKRIPHTYRENYLCLYFPPAREWHAGKFIAETIVPWISLWLFYYEGWLATGEWFGGGIHTLQSKELL